MWEKRTLFLTLEYWLKYIVDDEIRESSKDDRGRGKLGVWATIYKINNKILFYSIGNNTQYLVINYNGKEYEKEQKVYIYIYIYILKDDRTTV